MRALLLGVAASVSAIAIPAAPAQALDGPRSVFVSAPGSSFHGDFGRDRHDRRRHRRGDGDLYIGEWPQQGDTAWRSDSYNDWWHDRPDRAYPAWVQRNQNCERMWWSGGNWRC